MFNKEKLAELNTTPQEVAVLLCVLYDVNFDAEIKSLIAKGYISKYGVKPNANLNVTTYNTGRKFLNDVVMAQKENSKKAIDYSELASRLKSVFPKGKKDGTNNYWADGIATIVRRLQLFNHKYPNNYTDDDIVSAAERYVRSFNGQYRTMRTLKYFMFKEEVNAAGENEGVSDLLATLESDDSSDSLSGFDWDTNIV